jgi:hypothetical protein
VKKEVTNFISKNGVPVKVEGTLNLKVWASKIKQVIDDLEAGRYEKDKE